MHFLSISPINSALFSQNGHGLLVFTGGIRGFPTRTSHTCVTHRFRKTFPIGLIARLRAALEVKSQASFFLWVCPHLGTTFCKSKVTEYCLVCLLQDLTPPLSHVCRLPSRVQKMEHIPVHSNISAAQTNGPRTKGSKNAPCRPAAFSRLALTIFSTAQHSTPPLTTHPSHPLHPQHHPPRSHLAPPRCRPPSPSPPSPA